MTKAEFNIIVKNVVTHGNTLKYMAIYVNKYCDIAIHMRVYENPEKECVHSLFNYDIL